MIYKIFNFHYTAMHDHRKDFLITEFTAISDHFRSYQNNRLNNVLLSVPAIGAIMLHCYEREHLVRGISVSLLYILLSLLITLDEVFMKRLRNYTRRLSIIETEFEVEGYVTMRIKDVQNNYKDATTKAFRIIFHLLNFTITSYAILSYAKMREFLLNKLQIQNIFLDMLVLSILILIGFSFYDHTKKQLDTKNLPGVDQDEDANSNHSTSVKPLNFWQSIIPSFATYTKR